MNKTKTVKVSEQTYDEICRTLTFYDDESIDIADLASDMADLLAEIQRAYEDGEETD